MSATQRRCENGKTEFERLKLLMRRGAFVIGFCQGDTEKIYRSITPYMRADDNLDANGPLINKSHNLLDKGDVNDCDGDKVYLKTTMAESQDRGITYILNQTMVTTPVNCQEFMKKCTDHVDDNFIVSEEGWIFDHLKQIGEVEFFFGVKGNGCKVYNIREREHSTLAETEETTQKPFLCTVSKTKHPKKEIYNPIYIETSTTTVTGNGYLCIDYFDEAKSCNVFLEVCDTQNQISDTTAGESLNYLHLKGKISEYTGDVDDCVENNVYLKTLWAEKSSETGISATYKQTHKLILTPFTCEAFRKECIEYADIPFVYYNAGWIFDHLKETGQNEFFFGFDNTEDVCMVYDIKKNTRSLQIHVSDHDLMLPFLCIETNPQPSNKEIYNPIKLETIVKDSNYPCFEYFSSGVTCSDYNSSCSGTLTPDEELYLTSKMSLDYPDITEYFYKIKLMIGDPICHAMRSPNFNVIRTKNSPEKFPYICKGDIDKYSSYTCVEYISSKVTCREYFLLCDNKFTRNERLYLTSEMQNHFPGVTEGIVFITDLIAPQIEHPTRRNYALLPYRQEVNALQYYATGTFQMVVGDLIQVSQPTSCKVVNRVSRALARNIKNFVKFPEQGQVDAISDGFYRTRNFLGVIAALMEHMSGYFHPILMMLSLSTGKAIERWKRRFPILRLKNQTNNPESACRVMAATAALHNIAVDRKEPDIEDIELGQEQPDDVNYDEYFYRTRIKNGEPQCLVIVHSNVNKIEEDDTIRMFPYVCKGDID
ncbi:putative nuclease HARBI1 [Nymphon striatum]|nr:putative nuclease HARBI1 [Nymphon striatum]